MNVDTGKISPQFHVIFDDKFETVVSMNSEELIGEQWKSIFGLKWECFKDVDYDGAGTAILPPLTSLFQHNDFANEIIPTSQWTLDPNNITSPLAPGASSPVPSVVQTMPGDVVAEGVPSETEAHMDSAPEEASHESLVQLDQSPATVISMNFVDNGLSASGRPWRNVGNYKQGSAKIQRLPIDGEQYDFSFSVISEWDQPVPVVANHANVQPKYHPQQHLHKSFLA